MNSNGPRKKMITIISIIVAIGIINLIFSVYSKISAQNQSNEGLIVYLIFSLVFSLGSSLSLILVLKNKDSIVEESRSFDGRHSQYTINIPYTKENTLIMKTIVALIFGGLIVMLVFFMNYPKDGLKLANIFVFLQDNIINILAICFLLLCGFGAFHSIDYYSDPEKQRYYNSAEYREKQIEKFENFFENVQKFINYLKTLFHKNN